MMLGDVVSLGDIAVVKRIACQRMAHPPPQVGPGRSRCERGNQRTRTDVVFSFAPPFDAIVEQAGVLLHVRRHRGDDAVRAFLGFDQRDARLNDRPLLHRQHRQETCRGRGLLVVQHPVDPRPMIGGRKDAAELAHETALVVAVHKARGPRLPREDGALRDVAGGAQRARIGDFAGGADRRMFSEPVAQHGEIVGPVDGFFSAANHGRHGRPLGIGGGEGGARGETRVLTGLSQISPFNDLAQQRIARCGYGRAGLAPLAFACRLDGLIERVFLARGQRRCHGRHGDV